MDGRGAEGDEHQTEGAVGEEAEGEGLSYKTVLLAAVDLVPEFASRGHEQTSAKQSAS
jgi:hypothetical protein